MKELENWAGNKYIKLVDAKDAVVIVLEHHEDCKDEYIDEVLEAMNDLPTIKLRLMRAEECAGHTIEYAAGWKACIEWIKNGGDGGLFDSPTIEVSEDAISRNRVLKYIADTQLAISDEKKPTVEGRTVCDWIFDEVKEFPSVVPSRPTGKWIKNDTFECDRCHYKMIVGDGAYNYCPNCGSRNL